MNFNTHQAAGLLAAGLVLSFTNTEIGTTWLLGALAGSIGAALPDIDHRKSTPSQSVPMAGYLGKAMKHRGPITHSIWSLLIFGGPFYFYRDILLTSFPLPVILCFFAGLYSHHFLDKFTPQGLRWLWPLEINFWPIPQILRISTDSWMEKTLVRPGLWIATAYYWVFPLIR